MKFIRVNGRVVPIKDKGEGKKPKSKGPGPLNKRKGARYDKESGYHLSKKQRSTYKAIEKETQKKINKDYKKFVKPARDTGAKIGVASGVGYAVYKGKGSLGIMKYAAIAGVAGMVAGTIYGANKSLKKKSMK